MSRKSLEAFNYWVEEDPLAAVLDVRNTYLDDISRLAVTLSVEPPEEWTSLADITYCHARALAEDMLACSKQARRHPNSKDETVTEGAVRTRSLGNFLVCRAVHSEDALPRYDLFISNDAVDTVFEENEDTYMGADCVAKIEPLNGIYHPSLTAELVTAYRNMLIVANDRLHHRRKFV